MEEAIGIYVHVPFCARKCPYCDFYSTDYRKQAAEDYTAAVLEDMGRYAGQEIVADTLYFGGGTPSLLHPELIGQITAAAREVFSLSGEAEITMEANPNTVNLARLSAYHDCGVNRLSFGMQSADERELAALGRAHTAVQAAEAVNLAIEAGIRNVSLDLMLGTPYQDVQSLSRTLDLVAELPITHLSAYMLKVEEGTAYDGSELLRHCADDDTLADLYLLTVERLNSMGILQYEISNFARPGYESRHNLKYWRCGEYLGFGPAAHAYFAGRRTCNPPSLERYLTDRGRNPIVTDERPADGLPPDMAPGSFSERVMLGLRLTEGIGLGKLERDFPLETAALRKKAAPFISAGLAEWKEGDCLALTVRGFLLSSSMISALI